MTFIFVCARRLPPLARPRYLCAFRFLAREGGPFGQRFRPAAPARSCRVGRFTTRSKPAAEGTPAFHLLVPFPRAREGGASASGFRLAAPARSCRVGAARPDRKPLAEGWLWRVCALAFQAGEIVLLIRGRAGAKAARGEFLVALAALVLADGEAAAAFLFGTRDRRWRALRQQPLATAGRREAFGWARTLLDFGILQLVPDIPRHFDGSHRLGHIPWGIQEVDRR